MPSPPALVCLHAHSTWPHALHGTVLFGPSLALPRWPRAPGRPRGAARVDLLCLGLGCALPLRPRRWRCCPAGGQQTTAAAAPQAPHPAPRATPTAHLSATHTAPLPSGTAVTGTGTGTGTGEHSLLPLQPCPCTPSPSRARASDAWAHALQPSTLSTRLQHCDAGRKTKQGCSMTTNVRDVRLLA